MPGEFPRIGQMVFGHQAFFVELYPDVPFHGLEGLDVLESGDDSFDLTVYQDGDPVGRYQVPLELHHLADF